MRIIEVPVFDVSHDKKGIAPRSACGYRVSNIYVLNIFMSIVSLTPRAVFEIVSLESHNVQASDIYGHGYSGDKKHGSPF